jgi:translation initiation factor IF-2
MPETEIGKVAHYFDKAGVAVIKLSGSLSAGDALKFVKGENEFTEIVESMQIDYKPVTAAQSGQEVAIKISQKTKEGATVYKVEA